MLESCSKETKTTENNVIEQIKMDTVDFSSFIIDTIELKQQNQFGLSGVLIYVKFKNTIKFSDTTNVFLNFERMDDVTNGATYYHADYVNPKWTRLQKETQIGRHIFYKSKIDQIDRTKGII